MKKKCIGVLGSGSWATALVKILSENTLNLNWFIRNPESIEQIKKNRYQKIIYWLSIVPLKALDAIHLCPLLSAAGLPVTAEYTS